jgi:DNA excision repair protein ERCC-2
MSGLGKTAAVLSGTILAAREENLRILYACRTKREVARVVEELSRLQARMALDAGYLFSKYDYCLLMRRRSRPVPPESFKWYCNFNVSNNLCSYFLNLSLLGDELTDAVSETSRHIPTHAGLMEKGERLHVCPYELERLAAPRADVMVIPYQYLFEEGAKSVLGNEGPATPAKTILVVDEAHNLRDFLRNSATFTLSPEVLGQAVGEARAFGLKRLADSISELEGLIGKIISEGGTWFLRKESFIDRIRGGHDETWLANLALELTSCAGAAWYSVATGAGMPLQVLKVGNFLGSLLAFKERETVVLARAKDSILLVDVDATRRFASVTKGYHSVILLSATISPCELFARSIGIEESRAATYRVEANLPVTVRTVLDTGVTTRYRFRTREMYQKISRRIATIANSVRGSVGVFAPSYILLESLVPEVSAATHEAEIMVERRGLSNREASQLIDAFKSREKSVLFGVQGGRFSEGEDFGGDLVDASIIVGLAMPPPSPALYAEYSHLKRSGTHDSYVTISLLPAIRKAFQAAGRHLRDPGKRGMVFLLDSRFSNPAVLELTPSWLKQDMITGDFSDEEIERMIEEFFEKG